MKTLELTFVKNCDKTGDNTFTQVKRYIADGIEGGVAMYKREDMTGALKGFEVFIFKVIHEGASLPGGNTVQESYEGYPGPNSFGKTAYFCTSIERAEERYTELVNKLIKKNSPESVESDPIAGEVIAPTVAETPMETPVKTGKRGRKPVVRTIVYPENTFNMKQLVSANPDISQPVLYVELKKVISLGHVKEVDRVKSESGRGKLMVLYSTVK